MREADLFGYIGLALFFVGVLTFLLELFLNTMDVSSFVPSLLVGIVFVFWAAILQSQDNTKVIK